MSQASTTSHTSPPSTRHLKRVRLVTPVGLSTMEVYDLTTLDEGEEGSSEQEELDLQFHVRMVRCCHQEGCIKDEKFYECREVDYDLHDSIPKDTTWFALDWQDLSGDEFHDIPDEDEEPARVAMVRGHASVVITLDSGADISVAPPAFYSLGEPGSGRPVHMIDAQGERIQTIGSI